MQIFEYFDLINLYATFASTTAVVDQLLFTQANRYLRGGLKLGFDAVDLPAQIPFNCITTLTLREPAGLNVIEHCYQLRFLKLIGRDEWILDVMEKLLKQTSNLINSLLRPLQSNLCQIY